MGTAPASTGRSSRSKALELYGPPVYVRKEIVHNKHVVTTLEKRGAIFVDDRRGARGATVIFSARMAWRPSSTRRLPPVR